MARATYTSNSVREAVASTFVSARGFKSFALANKRAQWAIDLQNSHNDAQFNNSPGERHFIDSAIYVAFNHATNVYLVISDFTGQPYDSWFGITCATNNVCIYSARS